MRPPFVLEAAKSHYENEPSPHSIVPKRTYTSPVKVENWQHHMSKDVASLFSTPAADVCDHYKTSYEAMNECLRLKGNYVDPQPSQYFFNYFGYNANKTSDEVWKERARFPIIFNNDHNICPTFDTTMQKSYRMPYPMVLKDMRKSKWHMKYGRMKNANSKENTKFTDDGERERTRLLSAERSPLFTSYNFMTGLMTDGKPPKAMSFLQAGLLRQERGQ